MNSVCGHVDFEVYVGQLGRNVKEIVGHNGQFRRRVWIRDKSLEVIKISEVNQESSKVKGLIGRNIIVLNLPIPFEVRHGHMTYFGQ